MIRYVVAGVLLAAIVVGIAVMRERLETRHEVMPADSQLIVDASAEVRGPRERAPSMAEGLVAACVVEAADEAEVVRFTWRGHGRFRFVTRPALDHPDRRQLHGCLEDFRVPRLLVGAVTMKVRTAAT